MIKKIQFLLFAAGLLTLGSCNKDDIIPEQPGATGNAPRMTATVGEEILTKAGVIEDNADYHLGEKFTWHDGDRVKVMFGEWGQEVMYTASNVLNKRADFTPDPASVTAATYDVYGLYPAAGWNGGNVVMPSVQKQTGTGSEHLAGYMFMKAASPGFEHNETNELHLSYKHLTSVLRFSVMNATGNNNLKLKSITVSTGSGAQAFGIAAQLWDMSATSLTVFSKTSSITLETDGSFADSGLGGPTFDAFMAALPTDVFDPTDDLVIELLLSDGINNYGCTKVLGFGSAAAFLAGGIEKGKSYYFKLKVNSTDITPVSGDVYAVGDVYPKNGTAEGLVYQIKPGSYGTHGKIVSLKEGTNLRWGPGYWDDGTNSWMGFVDEAAAGVVGIRGEDNGAPATKNMIDMYKGAGNFASDYAAWHWIYQTMNGNDENGKWYMPAINELQDLYGAYASDKSGFNVRFTGAGGAALSDSFYWSSSEASDSFAFSVGFDNGYAGIGFKYYDDCVRCVSAF